MRKAFFVIQFLFSLLLISSNVFSQSSEEDVRVAYIYQFPNYIEWQKESDKFRIGCFTTDKTMINKLKYVGDTRKIKKKDVIIQTVDNLEQLRDADFNILYFDYHKKLKIEDVLMAIKGKEILLITNNSQEKQSIMINFLSSEKEGVVRFEVNKKNIVDEGLIISPDILLLGGSFVDVRELFHEKEQELEEIESKLEESLQEIEKKQKIIDQHDITISQKNELIAKKTQEINAQNAKLKYQQNYLDSLIKKVDQKQTQIKGSNVLIKEQLKSISEHKAEIVKSKKEIEKTRVELSKQKQMLSDQGDEIASQKKVLNEQMTLIQMQQNALLGGIIIVVLILSLVYFIYRGLRQKKRANAKLKEVNDEIIVQNEEIKSQREEILAARDQLEETNKQLENRNNELDKYRLHLEDLVKQRTEDLLIEKEKAEEASRMKTSFIENMSHEIRTPMNAILGFTRLITTMDLSDLTKNEYINIINSNADNLMRFINDLIDLSNIESGEIYISKSKADLNNLMNELQVVYSENLKKEGKSEAIKLIVHKDDQSMDLYSDHLRIKQLYENLLSNALKFTRKGSIEFGYEKNNDSLRCFVKDTGIGIPKDKHEFIFQRFSKIEDDNSTVYRGVGIGLSICKSIVEALDGEIQVKSQPGQGSEFSFVLPIK